MMEHLPHHTSLLSPAPAMPLGRCRIWQGEEILVNLCLHKEDLVET